MISRLFFFLQNMVHRISRGGVCTEYRPPPYTYFHLCQQVLERLPWNLEEHKFRTQQGFPEVPVYVRQVHPWHPTVETKIILAKKTFFLGGNSDYPGKNSILEVHLQAIQQKRSREGARDCLKCFLNLMFEYILNFRNLDFFADPTLKGPYFEEKNWRVR